MAGKLKRILLRLAKANVEAFSPDVYCCTEDEKVTGNGEHTITTTGREKRR